MLVTFVIFLEIASKPLVVLYLPGLGLLSGDYEYETLGEKLRVLLFSFLNATFYFASYPKVESLPMYYPGPLDEFSIILCYSRYSTNVKFLLILYLFFFDDDLVSLILFFVAERAFKILLVGVSWEIIFIF